MVAEVKLNFEYPDGTHSGIEIWPADVRVAQVLGRLGRELGDRKEEWKGATTWGLFVKDRGFLPRDIRLAELDLRAATKILVRDERERQEAADELEEIGREAERRGFVGMLEAGAVKDLLGKSGLAREVAQKKLEDVGVAPPWPERLLAGEAYFPQSFADYRQALKVVPKPGKAGIAEDLLRALERQRQKLGISEDTHLHLCQDLEMDAQLAGALLAAPPPRQAVLDAYEAELARFRTEQSVKPRDLERLVELRKKNGITIDEHHQLGIKLGMSPARIQALYDGKISKEAAEAAQSQSAGLALYEAELEKLRKQPPQRREDLERLVLIRSAHEITALQHQRVCQKVGIPEMHVKPYFEGVLPAPPPVASGSTVAEATAEEGTGRGKGTGPQGGEGREAARRQYIDALRHANLDGAITGDEKRKLEALRGELKVTIMEHRALCQEAGIAPDRADWLLTPEAASKSWFRWLVMAIVLLIGTAVAALVVMEGIPWYRRPVTGSSTSPESLERPAAAIFEGPSGPSETKITKGPQDPTTDSRLRTPDSGLAPKEPRWATDSSC